MVEILLAILGFIVSLLITFIFEGIVDSIGDFVGWGFTGFKGSLKEYKKKYGTQSNRMLGFAVIVMFAVCISLAVL